MLHIGVDVARFGDDKTVITPRISARVYEFRKYSKKDTMETAGNVIKCCKDSFSVIKAFSKGRLYHGTVTSNLKKHKICRCRRTRIYACI